MPECTLLLAGIPPSQISELAEAKDQLAAEKERMTEEKHKSLETMTRTLAIATEKVRQGRMRLGGRAGSLLVEGFAAVPADILLMLRQCSWVRLLHCTAAKQSGRCTPAERAQPLSPAHRRRQR